MAQLPAPTEGIALTHFIVSRDVERSRRLYVDVLGGEAVLEGALSIVALANGWITISVGGGPADDKPTVTLEPSSDPNRASSFLNIRVANNGHLRNSEIGDLLRVVQGSCDGSMVPAGRPVDLRWFPNWRTAANRLADDCGHS